MATIKSFFPALTAHWLRRLLRTPTSLAWLAGGAIFLLDLQLPNGLVDGFLYVLVVLICRWSPNPRAPVYAALMVMPLMALGFFLSPMAATVWTRKPIKIVTGGEPTSIGGT